MNIDAILRDLEQQKAKISTAIASLQALNGHKEVTVIGAAIAHLRKAGKPQTSIQLRNAIFAAGVNATPASIQTILSKRARAKRDILHKGRGLWGVKEG